MKKPSVVIGALFALAAAILLVLALAFWRIRSTKVVLGVPSGELAFNSNRTGQWDAFTLDPAGHLFNVTGDGGGQDYFVSWAFSGDMFNILTSRSGEMGPAQVRPDGSDLHTLGIIEGVMTVFLEGRIDWDPAWSPDGERLVFSSVRDLNLEIYVSDRHAKNRLRLTHDGGRDWFPAWSPDGTRVAFSSDRDGNENIYVIDGTGDDLVQLTDHPANDIYAMWSLDGATILFVSERDHSLTTGQLDLFLMNADGSDLHLLGDDENFVGDPTYSSDGAQIAYISNEAGDWNIYVMDADGGNVRRITDSAAADLFPVWRPIPEATEDGN